MANTVHGPYAPTSWVNGSTPISQTHLNNGETQSAVALHSFNPYHVSVAFVLSGVACTKDIATASQLDITAGEAVLLMTDGTYALIDVVATTESASGHPSTTLYLDLNPDGTWSFATTHSAQANYLPICQVTTDGSSNILTVTDERNTSNFLFNSQQGGLVTPAPLFTAVTQSAAYVAQVVGGVTFAQRSLLSSSMNGAALFNGSTGYLTFPTSSGANPLPTGNNAWSIEAWFSTSYASGSQVIVFAGTPSTKEAMWLYLDSAGHVTMDLYGSALSSSASGYNNGARHHAVATWDGTNATLYVDGAQVGSSATLGPDAIAYSGGLYGLIGVYYTGSAYSAFFNGTLDEVAIYGAHLTSTRVTAHYNAGISITSDAYAATVEADTPLRYYRLGDASGATTAASAQAAAYLQAVAADGTLTPQGIGGQASAGSFFAPVIVAQALDVHVTATGGTTILTYMPPVTGLYRLSGHASFGNATGEAVTFSVAYTDPHLGGPTAYFTAAGGGNAGKLLDGVETALAADSSVPTSPVVIEAATGHAITVTWNDPGGTPNDYVSVIVERLS